MNSKLPLSVLRYLKTQPSCGRAMAFMGLDENNTIVSSGGDYQQCGFPLLENGQSIIDVLPPIEQLLPIGNKPVIIANFQLLENIIIDLHLFTDNIGQWIIVFDNKEAGTKLQLEQQERLLGDIISEQNSKTSDTG